MKRLLGGVIAAVLVTASLAVTTTSATATPAAAPVLSPTPYMGWNTYYGLGGDFTEDTIKSVADSLVSRGLAKAGYDIVWLDGGWQADQSRSAAGDLVPNPAKFPNGLKPLVDYIHSKGLKAGIYTDAVLTSRVGAVSAAAATTSATRTSSPPGASTRSRSTTCAVSRPTWTRRPCSRSSRRRCATTRVTGR
jgi:hypothetical protein